MPTLIRYGTVLMTRGGVDGPISACRVERDTTLLLDILLCLPIRQVCAQVCTCSSTQRTRYLQIRPCPVRVRCCLPCTGYRDRELREHRGALEAGRRGPRGTSYLRGAVLRY